MCNKLDLYFTSDIENLFGSGVGGVFEVGVEEKSFMRALEVLVTI